MELANIAFNIGKSVAVAAKNLNRKRKHRQKYLQFENEADTSLPDGKPDLLFKFLKDAVVGRPSEETFVNPFKNDLHIDYLQKGDRICDLVEVGVCEEPEVCVVSLLERTPGDGAETPTTNYRQWNTRGTPRGNSIRASKTLQKKPDDRKFKKTKKTHQSRGPVRISDKPTENFPIKKRRHMTDHITKHVSNSILRRVPSLNTAFLQNDSCSLDGSLLLLGTDRGDSVYSSCVVDSNVFENAFINYGVL